MITKMLWKDFFKQVNEWYKWEEKYEKKYLNIYCLALIVTTPFTLVIDIFMLPFEILYIIIDKILWRKGW